MKKIVVITSLLTVLLIVGWSCSSPTKENKKRTETESTTGSKMPTETDKSSQPSKLTPVSRGEKLFADNGCIVCHHLDSKLVGPALKDVASAYTNNKGELIAFLKGKGKAIVDPAQAALMQPQIAITSSLSANDLNTLADYILSIK